MRAVRVRSLLIDDVAPLTGVERFQAQVRAALPEPPSRRGQAGMLAMLRRAGRVRAMELRLEAAWRAMEGGGGGEGGGAPESGGTIHPARMNPPSPPFSPPPCASNLSEHIGPLSQPSPKNFIASQGRKRGTP